MTHTATTIAHIISLEGKYSTDRAVLSISRNFSEL
jgi:hypothetical protein